MEIPYTGWWRGGKSWSFFTYAYYINVLIFQNAFFSFSSFQRHHKNFLFQISKLKDHLPFKSSEGRIISHIKGLLKSLPIK